MTRELSFQWFIGKYLFQDLRQLATNGIDRFEEPLTPETKIEEELINTMSSPLFLQQSNLGEADAFRTSLVHAKLPKTLQNYPVEGRKHTKHADHGFYEDVLVTIEKNNKTLEVIKKSQNIQITNVQQCPISKKLSKY